VKAIRFAQPDGEARIGVLEGETIRDAGPSGPAGFVPTGEAWAALRDASGPELALADVRVLPPVVPGKIAAIGLNYRSHAEETKQEIPAVPTVFGKFRNALAAPGAAVELPGASEKVDYEAEVCVVIGARLKNASAGDALAGIAGYTLMNDLSARDLQLATTQWMSGKTFDGAAPCGPALVTKDEVDHDAIEFSLTLNGEEMQSSATSDLIFAAPELVAHLSTLMTLAPGDLVSTGTPSGVGIARRPSVWLRPGDVIEISSPQLGLLRTRVS
jgi:2-keto-4-pentenoate hydratase/2-oxohepta-3-ene-1,7-dioic acid hydratase in catechol pathway